MTTKDLWINLFDISLEKYHTEDSNIRNMAMLLHVFRLEFKKVSKCINDLQMKNEIQSKSIEKYENELKNCNCKANIRSPLKTLTENKNLLKSPKINQSYLSDDIFNEHISEAEENDGSLFINDSISSPITSPTLNTRKSRSFRAISKNQNLNNSSVILGTPTLNVNKKVKKMKQSKLPMSFCSKNKNCNDSDATFCFPDRNATNEMNKSGGDDIDDILDELNYPSSPPNSKKAKFDNSYDCPTPSHISPKIVFKREAVRKKSERAQMQGWGCQDCEKYYGGLNLPEDELKIRMNRCSKHRDNFNPMRLTPEGFWNPDFTPTQNSFVFDL